MMVRKPPPRTRSACNSCARSRTKCDGEQPCGRCQKRSTQCDYRDRSTKKAKTRDSSQQSSSGNDITANLEVTGQDAMVIPMTRQHKSAYRVNDNNPASFSNELTGPGDNGVDRTPRQCLGEQGSNDSQGSSNGPSYIARPPHALTIEGIPPAPDLANPELDVISHNFMLTLNGAVPDLQHPTGDAGHSGLDEITDLQHDIDMEIPSQAFDSFWCWLDDFGTDRWAHGPSNSHSTEPDQLGTEAWNFASTQASGTSDESPEAPSPWPLSWTPNQMDAGLPATEAGDVPEHMLEMENFAHVARLSCEKYEEIVENLQNHANQPVYRSFGSPVLPSAEVMSCFIQLYFEHFHDTMPFIHKSSFDPSREHWVLVMAVAATGSRFSQVPRSDLYALKLTELVRRSIMVIVCQSNLLQVRMGTFVNRLQCYS